VRHPDGKQQVPPSAVAGGQQEICAARVSELHEEFRNTFFLPIGDEAFAPGIDGGDALPSVSSKAHSAGGVPMKLANAAGG
jgi:hypothetical protein